MAKSAPHMVVKQELSNKEFRARSGIIGGWINGARRHHLIRLISVLVAVLSMSYVFMAIRQGMNRLPPIELTVNLMGVVGVVILLWLAVQVWLGGVWWTFLKAFNVPLTIGNTIQISLKSQIAKYLPGNVGQHVGRVLMARKHGVTALDAARTLVAEAFVLVLAAIIVGGPVLAQMLKFDLIPPVLVQILIVALALLLVGVVGPRIPIRLGEKGSRRYPSGRWLMAGFAMTIGFFFLGAGGLCLVMEGVSSAQIPFSQLLAGWATAFLAGYVVVGAPGGIGVREAVFVLVLKDAAPEAVLGFTILAFRILTSIADLGAFLLAAAIPRYLAHHSPETDKAD